MPSWFHPKDTLNEKDIRRGMRMLLAEGACGQTMLVLTTGAFLVGFALLLGASNKVIGLFAAIGPLSLTLQIPAVYLVERLRHRKLLVTTTAFVSRAAWFLIAALPWIVPRSCVIPVFLAALFVHYGLGAVAGCGFNSWFRDLIPGDKMSGFLAKRLAFATAIGAVLSFVGGYSLDLWKARFGSTEPAYAILYAVAATAGVLGVGFIARTPEPRMPEADASGFWGTLQQPLRDTNFRKLLVFLGWWSFGVNFAAPFFAVYMIQRLDLTMTWVLGLGVVSQLINVVFFQIWATIADRHNNKSVLVFTGTLFILTFLLWPFTTMPNPHFLTMPILILIHAVAGVSTAGVNLCAGNLALKIAPYGKAGSYLAMNALISGIAASIAPILAGFAADWFASENLSLTIRLASTAGLHPEYILPTVNIGGLDYVILIGFVFGMYSVHRLLAVREEGEVRESEVRQALFGEMRRVARQVSTVAGVRQVVVFPSLIRTLGKPKQQPKPEL